jgi:hypothetical protein
MRPKKSALADPLHAGRLVIARDPISAAPQVRVSVSSGELNRTRCGNRLRLAGQADGGQTGESHE